MDDLDLLELEPDTPHPTRINPFTGLAVMQLAFLAGAVGHQVFGRTVMVVTSSLAAVLSAFAAGWFISHWERS